MKNKQFVAVSLLVVALIVLTSVALAASGRNDPSASLVDTVRQETAKYKDLSAAEAAGYSLLLGCVSSTDGVMGVHYVRGDLVGDGTLDAANPEALIYEFKNGKANLVGVEFVAIADAWNASHDTPPVLNGQLFDLHGSPNRYGIPAFYALHVWAWRKNPSGTFADWNPRVSCDGYTASSDAN